MRRSRLLLPGLVLVAVLALAWLPSTLDLVSPPRNLTASSDVTAMGTDDSSAGLGPDAAFASAGPVARSEPDTSFEAPAPSSSPSTPTDPPTLPPTDPPTDPPTNPPTLQPSSAPSIATPPLTAQKTSVPIQTRGPPTPEPTLPPLLNVAGLGWLTSKKVEDDIRMWKGAIDAARDTAAAAAAPPPCPPVAHVVWPFATVPGPRVAAVVRALTFPTLATLAGPPTDGGPFDQIFLYVPDRAVLDVNPSVWQEVLAQPKVTVRLLRTESLLDGTPLARWGRWTTPWKIFSGPDFPYQLDLAVRLAVAHRYGGHVVPLDFLRLQTWSMDGTVPYVVHGDSMDVGWTGGIGPLCAPEAHVAVLDVMQALAAVLDECATAAFNSTAESGFMCAIPFATFMDRLAGYGACAVDIHSLLQPSTGLAGAGAGAAKDNNLAAPSGSCRLRVVAPEAVAGLTVGGSIALKALFSQTAPEFKHLSPMFGPGPYIGIYLAHILVGTLLLPTQTLLPMTLAELQHGTLGILPSAPWHQGCGRLNTTSPEEPTPLPPLVSRLQEALAVPSPDPQFATFAFLVALKSFNLGDDIQAFASLDFLPFVGYAVNRDRWQYIWPLSSSVGRPPTRMYPAYPVNTIFTIMNGWWDYLVRDPPTSVAASLNSVFTGFHMAKYRIKSKSGPAMAEVLRKFAPIGTRDLNTLGFLHNYTVPSYLAGCMTTTLRNPFPGQRTDRILLVPKYEDDIAAFMRILPADVLSRAYWISIHSERREVKMTFRRSMRAWDLIHEYATARLVITSALHSALPSIAFDTPTLFVHEEKKYAHDERFPGLAELFPTIRFFTNVSEPITDFDFDNPKPPSAFPETHGRLHTMRTNLRNRLRRTCAAVDINLTMTQDAAA